MLNLFANNTGAFQSVGLIIIRFSTAPRDTNRLVAISCVAASCVLVEFSHQRLISSTDKSFFQVLDGLDRAAFQLPPWSSHWSLSFRESEGFRVRCYLPLFSVWTEEMPRCPSYVFFLSLTFIDERRICMIWGFNLSKIERCLPQLILFLSRPTISLSPNLQVDTMCTEYLSW